MGALQHSMKRIPDPSAGTALGYSHTPQSLDLEPRSLLICEGGYDWAPHNRIIGLFGSRHVEGHLDVSSAGLQLLHTNQPYR